jgi:hypothetical protein
MAVTAIWTQADIDALKAAVATGVLSVRYDGPPGRTITYQSITEMRSLLSEMISNVADASGKRTGYRFAAHRKGT